MSSVMKEIPGERTPLSTSDGLERSPLPVPYGWFFVSYSEELKPGELRNIECFGQEWVLFRAETGDAGVVDPYCPHLGAHLGHGGKVEGDSQTWNRRYREYTEKIKTGSPLEIAKVLRDLLVLKGDKELSFGERKMLDTARSLLVKELSIAKALPEEKIMDELKAIFAN